MQESWNEYIRSLSPALRDLRVGSSDVMKGFSAIAQGALAPRALDRKTKELIALALSVASRCDDCIGFHAKAALEQGASREEVFETLGTAIYLGAGPAVMYAAHAIEAFDQLSADAAARAAAEPPAREVVAGG